MKNVRKCKIYFPNAVFYMIGKDALFFFDLYLSDSGFKSSILTIEYKW